MFDVSIVTCSYNPDAAIFNRVLLAIERLNLEGIKIEYVIIDNNSSPPIISQAYMNEFLKRNSWARVLNEEKQGVAYARRLGIRSTTAPIIVFVDDDNELNPDYLISALSLVVRYPFVGIWGAGNISVELPSDTPKKLQGDLKRLYLQKKTLFEQYTTIVELSSPAYVICAGMVAHRQVMEKYLAFSESDRIQTTGRVGESGDSWEDTQMCWVSIKEGFAVGVSPILNFNHIIEKKRIRLRSMLRLSFEGSSGGRRALLEVFPIFYDVIKQELSGKKYAFVNYLIGSFPYILRFKSTKWLMFSARYWGNINSYYVALSLKPPILVDFLLGLAKYFFSNSLK